MPSRAMHFPAADAAERGPSLGRATEEERARRLIHLVRQHHWTPDELSVLSLRDAWCVVRDIVEAVERCAPSWGAVTGSDKLRLVEAVVWRLVAPYGGVGALRALMLAWLPPRWWGRALAGWVVDEGMTRALVRYTIELAVRESGARERRVRVTGLQRADNRTQRETRNDG